MIIIIIYLYDDLFNILFFNDRRNEHTPWTNKGKSFFSSNTVFFFLTKKQIKFKHGMINIIRNQKVAKIEEAPPAR